MTDEEIEAALRNLAIPVENLSREELIVEVTRLTKLIDRLTMTNISRYFKIKAYENLPSNIGLKDNEIAAGVNAVRAEITDTYRKIILPQSLREVISMAVVTYLESINKRADKEVIKREATMIETVLLPFNRFTTPAHEITCCLNINASSEICTFLGSRVFGTKPVCLYDGETSLETYSDLEYIKPHSDCPMWKIK